MKIEKGKLYLYAGVLEKSMSDDVVDDGLYSNKIAVYCKTQDDWDYLDNFLKTNWEYSDKFKYRLLDIDCQRSNGEDLYKDYQIITIDQFKEFYLEDECTEKNAITDKSVDNVQNNGHKETIDKLEYELDFEFITQMAERMQSNKGKYEPYNWQKSMDVEKLKQALFRHVIEIMKGKYEDDGRLMGHIEAIACNAMMINCQLNKSK